MLFGIMGKMEKTSKLNRLVNSWPAIVTALLYIAVFPTLSWSFLAFFFLVPILITLAKQGAGPKGAFWLFWLAGFWGNIGKMYWLVYTMNHYGHIPMPLAIFVFVLMTATLGMFWGFMGYWVYKIKKRINIPFVILFPATWVVMEWCLTWVLSGFPWGLIGNGLINMLVLAQFGDIFGVYGLSFFVIVGNVVFFELYQLIIKKKKEGAPAFSIAVFTILLTFIALYGLIRLPQIENILSKGKTIRVGLLQGNIDQLEKWKPGGKRNTYKIYRELTKASARQGAELLIFPETALPYWQYSDRKLSERIKKMATDTETYALVAYPYKAEKPGYLENSGEKKGFGDRNRYNRHNVTTLLDKEGNSLGTVMKHKLVPFGEFLPFPNQIIWLKNALGLKKARLTKGFSPAKGYNSIPYPPVNGAFGVAICYEIIFPAMVRKIANLDTDFLVTITNDSWFGDTSAPHQHVDQVAMRAIENRRSFARAANTGISCVVDATGRVRGQTVTYARTQTVDKIKTISIRSVYSKIGDLLVYLFIVLGVGLEIITFLKRRKKGGEVG